MGGMSFKVRLVSYSPKKLENIKSLSLSKAIIFLCASKFFKVGGIRWPLFSYNTFQSY